VGSSLFFLFFPVLVIISLDSEGQGILPFEEDRETPYLPLPFFTLSMQLQVYFLRAIGRLAKLESSK